jgi:transcriptional regulator with XRE-family HTH domain
MDLKFKLALLVGETTQRKVAKGAGIHESVLSRGVHGHIDLTKEQRERVAQVLGRPVKDVFEEAVE